MMSSKSAEISILSHLQEGDLTAAHRVLSAWHPTSETETLRHLYCRSKILLYEGAYMKALELLQTQRIHTPHCLDTLCDLALCNYQLGLQTDLDKTLLEAHSLFSEMTTRLTSQSEIDHAIFLAKLYEEKGCYQEAWDLLSTPTTGLNPKQEQALKIQQLRLAVELQNETSARGLYKEVISGHHHNLNFEIEREHTLLLADQFLFGLHQAKERFEYVISQNISPADKSFLKSEMAELLILSQSGESLSTLLGELGLDQTSKETAENTYEKIQAQLIGVFCLGAQKPQISVIRLEKILSPMSLLRLCRQVLLLFPDTLTDEAFTERYRFHCQSLPHRNLQDKFLAPLRTQKSDDIWVNTKDKKIITNGRESEIKSPLFWQLLTVLSETKQEASLDEIIAAVYQESPNAQHFDRLRVAIYRLNALLEAKGHSSPFFKITKNKVQLLTTTKVRAS